MAKPAGVPADEKHLRAFGNWFKTPRPECGAGLVNFEDCTLQLRDDETGEALLALMERKASLYVYTHIPVSLSIKFLGRVAQQVPPRPGCRVRRPARGTLRLFLVFGMILLGN